MPFRTGSPSGTTIARSCAKSLSRSFGSPLAGPALDGRVGREAPAPAGAERHPRPASPARADSSPIASSRPLLYARSPMRFLGLDSSTQSLTALVVDTDTGEVIDRSVGVRRAAAPVRLAERLPRQRRSARQAQRPADVGRGAGPGAGRAARRRRRPLRHRAASAAPASSTARSTWRAPLDEAGHLVDASAPLVDQVRPLLSRATAPIWMDASTRRRVRRDRRRRRRRRQDGGADRLASPSSASPARKSASSGRTTPPATSAPPRSTWSARSSRRC